MATIRNVIQTVFTSSGAKDTTSDIERLSRSQTRLGQASASAGRAFAAQSQGLGGLVAAYAGAAATTFALQQAFSKLSQSARALQTLEGLTSLATAAGQDANKLLSSVREISNHQLTIVSAAEQIAMSLSAGFNTNQIEGLADVALKASRALGRDLTDAMTRVTRGSAKMEAELLDELGIYTKIGPATRAYADAVGKSVTSLTEYERRQAFVNAVIDEGRRKFSAINTTIPTTSEKFEALATKVVDMATKVGMFLADVLTPFADFLTNNVAAAMSAFALAASLVAGKGIQVMSGALENLITKFDNWGIKAENNIKSWMGLSGAMEAANDTIRKVNLSSLNITETQRDMARSLQETAKYRALSTAELQTFSGILNSSVNNLNKETKAIQDNAKAKADAAATAQTASAAAIAERTTREQNLKTAKAEEAALIKRIDNANATIKSFEDQKQAVRDYEKKLTEARKAVDSSFGRGFSTKNIDRLNTAIEESKRTVSELTKAWRAIPKGTEAFEAQGKAVAAARTQLQSLNELQKVVTQKKIPVAPQDTTEIRSARGIVSSQKLTEKLTIATNRASAAEEAYANSKNKVIEANKLVGPAQREATKAIEAASSATQKLTEHTTASIAAQNSFSGVIAASSSAILSRLVPAINAAGVAFRFLAAGISAVFSAIMKLFFTVSIFTFIATSIANLIGMGEEFNAFIGKITKSIKAFFTDEDAQRREKAFRSLAGTALESLEKVDKKLHDTESFTFTSKIFLVDVEITKTKEDLVSEVSDAMSSAVNRANDILNISVAESFGAGLAWWLPIYGNDDIRNRIRDTEDVNRLTEYQVALYRELTNSQRDLNDIQNLTQRVAVKSLIEQLNGAENLSFAAREYLRTQLLILETLQGQESVVGRMQIIAEQLGITAHQVSQNFNIAIDDIANIGTVVSVLPSMSGIDIPISYVIANEKEVLEYLASIDKAINDSSDQIDKAPYHELVSDLRSVAQGAQENANILTRFTYNLNELSKSVALGTSDLEKMSQSYGVLRETILELEQNQRESVQSVEALRASYNLLDTLGAPTEILRALDSQIVRYEQIIATNDIAISQTRERFEAEKAIIEPIMEQLRLAEFLSETFKSQISSAQVTVGTLSSLGRITFDAQQKSVNIADTLNTFILQGNDALLERMSRNEAILSVSKQLNLNTAQTSELINATAAGQEEVVTTIIRELSLREEEEELLRSINSIEADRVALALTTETAVQAQIGYLQEALDTAGKLTEQFRDQRVEIDRQVTTLEKANELLALQNSLSTTQLRNAENNELRELQSEADRQRISNLTAINDLIISTNERTISTLELEKTLIEDTYDIIQSLFQERIHNLNLINEIQRRNSEQEQNAQEQSIANLERMYSLQTLQTSFATQGDTSSEIEGLQQIINAQRQLTNDMQAAALVAYRLQLQLLAEEEKQELAQLGRQESALRKELELNAIREDQARLAYRTEVQRNSLQSAMLREERALVTDRIQQEINTIGLQRDILNMQKEIADSEINQGYALEATKIDNSVKDVLDRYRLIAAQSETNEVFLREYARLITEHRRTIQGPEAVPITIDEVGEAMDTHMTRTISEANELKNILEQLRNRQLETSNMQNSLQVAELESIETLSRERLALEEFITESVLENDRASATERQRLAVQNIRTIEAEESTLVNQLARLADEKIRIEETYLARRVYATEDFVEQIMSLETDLNSFVSNIPDTVIQDARSMEIAAREAVNNITREIRSITDQTYVMQLKFEADLSSIHRDIARSIEEAKLEQLELRVRLVEATEDAGNMSAIQAAEEINSLQQDILNQQQILLQQEYKHTLIEISERQRIQEAEHKILVDNLKAEVELQKADIQNNLNYLRALVSIYQGSTSDQQAVLSNFNTAFAQTLGNFLAKFGAPLNSLFQGLNNTLSQIPELSGISLAIPDFFSGLEVEAGSMAQISSQLGDSLNTATEAASAHIDALERHTAAQVAQQDLNLQHSAALAEAERQQAGQLYQQRMDALNMERQIEEQNAQSRLNDVGGSGGGGDSDELRDKLKELQDSFKSTVDTLKDLVSDLISQIATIISDAITTILQNRLDQIIAQEELLSNIYESTTSRLSTVQSEIEETLSRELSLREQITSETENLIQTYHSYLESFGAEDGNVASASQDYLEKLYQQRKSMIELANTGKKAIALAKEEQSLADTQLQQQQALENVTRDRIAAEEQLEKIENTLSFITDALSGKFNQLADTMVKVGQTISAVLQMLGMAEGAGISLSGPSGSIFGELQSVISSFAEGVKELSGKTIPEISQVTGLTGEAAESYAQSLQTFNKISSIVSGTMTGFQIGTAVSDLVGDSGWATTIGGTIGGALASTFGPQLVSWVTSSIGTLAGQLVGYAIPVIGPIVGALVGSLFKKTPKMSATGSFEDGEFGITSTRSSGGAKRSQAEALGGIIDSIYDGISSSLESVGISFIGALNSTISSVKSTISATVTMANQTFSSGSLGKGNDALEAAAKWMADTFFQNVSEQDFAFDTLMVGIDNIRAAAINFTKWADTSEKTSDNFIESITFAQQFDESIESLIGTGASLAQVFNLIEKSAIANNFALTKFYTEGLSNTIKVFGEGSEQANEYAAAVRQNALAQIGLAEKTVDGTKAIIPLTDALADINAGAVMVHNTVKSIQAMTDALNAAGIENVFGVIEKGINVALSNLVGDVNTSLQEAINTLKNPASAIINDLTNIVQNGREATREITGQYEQLVAEVANGTKIMPEVLNQAQENIDLSKELLNTRLDAYLRSLSEAQLQALIASGQLESGLEELTESLLATYRAVSNQRAMSSLINSSKTLKSTIADVTGIFRGIDFRGLIGIGPDFQTLAESLGNENVEELTVKLGTMFNNIAKGVNPANNFNKSLQLLKTRYEGGSLSAENMANAIEHLIETSTEYLNNLNNLANQYEDTIKQISEALSSARGDVRSALEDLRDTIISSIEGFVSSSQTILKTFDDTLAGVASSGNELFDLQDKARGALQESSKALSSFEKEYGLSGRTSAQAAEELASVRSQIALLSDLDPSSFGLAEFLELSNLTGRERYLQNEISSLAEVESEYKNLINDRTKAQEDLAFVESTILGLGDQLIDTRRKESDIIKAAQDAAAKFVKGQEDLLTITELLAEAGFNLNQQRVDESDAVYTVTEALREYTQSLSTLETEIGSILGDNFLNDMVETAVNNAKQLYSHLTDAELSPILEEITLNATNAANEFIALAASLDAMLNPVRDTPTPINDTEVPYSDLVRIKLTDRFKEFNTDLIKYLDSEGLSKFYGPNGVFSDFRDALHLTLITDGFEILTASGGPLQNFGYYLVLTSQTIQDLTSDNAILNLSFQAITTEVGTLIVAMGETETGLKMASSALAITAETSLLARNGITSFNTAIGTFVFEVTGTDADKAIKIISQDIPNTINTLNQNVFLLGVSLANMTIEAPINTMLRNFNLSIGILDSSIRNINIKGPINRLVLDINNSFNTRLVNSINSITVRGSVDVAILNLRTQITDASINGSLANTIGSISFLAPVNTATINIINQLTNSNINGSLANTISNIHFANSVNVAKVNIINQLTNSNVSGSLSNVIKGISFDGAVGIASTNIINQLSNSNITGSLSNTIKNISFLAPVQIAITSIVNQLTNSSINGSLANAISKVTFAGSVGTVITNIANQLTNSNIAGSLSNTISTITFKGTVGLAINTIKNQLTGGAIEGSLANRIKNITFEGVVNTAVNHISNQLLNSNISGSLSNVIKNITFASPVSTAVSVIVNQLSGTNIAGSLANAVNTITFITPVAKAVATISNQLTNVSNTDSLANVISSISFNGVVNTVYTRIFRQLLDTSNNNSLTGIISSITFRSSVDTALRTINNELVAPGKASLSGFINSLSVQTSVNTAITNFKNQITDSSKTTSLAYFLSNVNITSSLTNFKNNAKSILDQAILVFDNMLLVFAEPKVSKVTNFITAMNNLNSVLIEVNNTYSLNDILKNFNTISTSSANNIVNLTTNFTNLQTAITSLIGTDGSITSVRNAITKIAEDLASAWNRFKVNIDTSAPKFTITMPNVNVDAGFDENSKKNIRSIAINSGLFQTINGLSYAYSNQGQPAYARGGYVAGPGTSTSDSISARLSNGEFVLRADSVRSIGLDTLNVLNATGNINAALSSAGRKGDSLVAHINTAEASLLKRLGGSGTRNPKTGLLEYSNRSTSIAGNLFGQKEANLLWNTYKNKMLSYSPENAFSLSNSAGWSGKTSLHMDKQYNARQGSDSNNSSFFSSNGWANINTWAEAMMQLSNEMLSSRGMKGLSYLVNSFGTKGSSNYLGENYLTFNDSSKVLNSGSVGYGRFKGKGRGPLSSIFNKYDWFEANGGTLARSNQLLNALFGTTLTNSAINQSSIETVIDKLNTDSVFADLYMLGKTDSNRPSAQFLTSGGLVTGDSIVNSLRDRAAALVEPGEFVLRKPVVDEVGINRLNSLNSTGTMDTDVNVEVNVINNGTNQQIVSQETRRREDGKIVLDVVLEDIRNNGPIVQTIKKSMRN